MSLLQAGNVLSSRFEILGVAGSGGMGTVYRARDRYTGDLIALKVLHREADQAYDFERFGREAQFLSQLRHPGIVSYVAHGSTLAGQHYLAMEWLEGEDLANRLKRGPLSLSEAFSLARTVAEALSLAHRQGVIHRDLKPSNLFLVNGEFKQAKVLDFGIARQIGKTVTLTQTGMALGTPHYMAPEQARGLKDLTPAADVFALGCVLYECLTGKPPFVGEHGVAVLVRILLEEPEPISTRLPGIPAQVGLLLGKMLSKDVAQRPADASALLEEIAELGVLPVLKAAGTPPPPVKRLSDSEQQLLCVVIAGPSKRQEGNEAEATGQLAPKLEDPEKKQELRQALESLGAQVMWLMDGSLVAVVTSSPMLVSSAGDQVGQAALCGLTIKRLLPECEVALGTGRGQVRKEFPAGEAVDRAVRLLRSRTEDDFTKKTPSGVWLDPLSERLLGERFTVKQVHGAALLHDDPGSVIGSVDESRRLLGKPTLCVGRDAEIGNLEGQLLSSIDESETRAVVITAAPGTGKSRLRHEFLRRVEQRHEQVKVLQARGEIISAGAPYGMLGQAIKRLRNISASDSAEQQQQAVMALIKRVIDEPDQQRVSFFVGELCGVRFPVHGNGKLEAARADPGVMRDQIWRAFIEWLGAELQQGPMLLVLDDLQWGDGLSVGLLDEALRKLRSTSLMVFALGRPELWDIFPTLFQGHKLQKFTLQGLSKKASERLVRQVLGKDLATDVVARIIEQSGGNALYLEELIRSVGEDQDKGTADTVLAMLQARIGRFEPGPRRVAKAASVFGQTFWQGGVATLLQDSVDAAALQEWLNALVAAEVIELHAQSRFSTAKEYGFRHGLIQEAAYSLLTESDLQVGHRLVAEYLEAAGETEAVAIADHYRRGGDLHRAGPQLLRAAEQAFWSADGVTAIARSQQALACDLPPEALPGLWTMLVMAHIWRNEMVQAVGYADQVIAALPPQHPLLSPSLITKSMVHLIMGNQETSDQLLLQICELTAEPQTLGLVLFGLTAGNYNAFRVCRADIAKRLRDRTEEIVAALENPSPLVLAWRASAESWQGGFVADAGASIKTLRYARDAFRELGYHRPYLCMNLFLGSVLWQFGALDEAIASMWVGIAGGAELGPTYGFGVACLIQTLAESGDFAGALDLASQFLDGPRQGGFPVDGGLGHWARAHVFLLMDRLAEAEVEARAAQAAVAPLALDHLLATVTLAEVLLRRGQLEEALAQSGAAIAEYERFPEIVLKRAHAYLIHAEALRQSGSEAMDKAYSLVAQEAGRLRAYAERLPPPYNRTFLENLRENVRILTLARTWQPNQAASAS